MTTSLLSNATRTDPLPRSPHPRYAAKPLVRGHFQQRRPTETYWKSPDLDKQLERIRNLV